MKGGMGWNPFWGLDASRRYIVESDQHTWPLSLRWVRGVLSEFRWDREAAAEEILKRVNDEGIVINLATSLRIIAQVKHVWFLERYRHDATLKL